MKKNPFSGLIIEYHIVQSFPCTCLNRDDCGTPKSATIGGVERARVSSQSWKRAVRFAMRDFSAVDIGVRTKHVYDMIVESSIKEGATKEQAESLAIEIGKVFVKAAKKDGDKEKPAKPENRARGRKAEVAPEDLGKKTDAILFFSPSEIKEIVKKFKENEFDTKKTLGSKGAPDFLAKIIKDSSVSKSELDGLDIALFGRMVAQLEAINVNGAASFSHAISTHGVANEFDYFTAVEDFDNAPGAAHLGNSEYNSATYYRYVSVDIGQLCENIGEEMIPKAIEAFTKALFIAVPAARQHTFAGYCPWDYAQVLIRRGQNIQLSCDTPVKHTGNGFSAPSIKMVQDGIEKNRATFGSLFGEKAAYEIGNKENYSIDNLISDLSASVASAKE